MATTMKLSTKMSNAAKVIEPTLKDQFITDPATLALIRKEQARTLRFIVVQQANVKKALTTYGVK